MDFDMAVFDDNRQILVANVVDRSEFYEDTWKKTIFTEYGRNREEKSISTLSQNHTGLILSLWRKIPTTSFEE